MRISSIRVKGSFKDANGLRHHIDEYFADGLRVLTFLPPRLRAECPSVATLYPMDSEAVFLSLIDPTSVPLEKKYAISRKLPPGDVERFHIVVGAKRSSTIHVRFLLYVDRTQVIASEPFQLKIINDRRNRFGMHYKCSDGDEFRQEAGVWVLTSSGGRGGSR